MRERARRPSLMPPSSASGARREVASRVARFSLEKWGPAAPLRGSASRDPRSPRSRRSRALAGSCTVQMTSRSKQLVITKGAPTRRGDPNFRTVHGPRWSPVWRFHIFQGGVLHKRLCRGRARQKGFTQVGTHATTYYFHARYTRPVRAHRPRRLSRPSPSRRASACRCACSLSNGASSAIGSSSLGSRRTLTCACRSSSG